MQNLSRLSISEAGAFVRAGKIRIPDLVRACLEREASTRGLAAFSDVYGEKALRLAQAHQSLLDDGYDLGPLHGMPIAVKANVDVAGETMTAGSKVLAKNVASSDAEVARRLKQAGAIIIGATNMHEFAWGGTTNNPHFGPCRNPWDRDRIPAGSSGGSAAAVAAGSAIAALGTDTGGSVRLPASMNGITGLRPGVGRISTKGVFPLAWSMDTVGPMARGADDCALLFSVLSGDAGRRRPAVESLRGLRVGVIENYSFDRLQPDIEAAFRAMLETLEKLGASIRPIGLHGLDVAVDAQVIVDAAEPSAVHASLLKDNANDYGEDVRILLHAGMSFTAIEYIQAQRYRTHLRDQLDRHFETVDVILTPTLPFTAPLIGQETVMIGDAEESTLTGNMRFTCIPSLAALPALSFPIGFDRDTLPIGAQIMGPADAEFQLLSIARLYQTQTDFHQRHPE
ncbi:amidase [Rhizobium sp. 2MFCol3.1]|uniref:amidase n=1 Tax=Rhizobium sp. 2MFCol3.1 TaxID=1246459 RepID=UPI00037FF0F4|nr:amidase [Rhizobium sp. 2MFCol3.1]